MDLPAASENLVHFQQQLHTYFTASKREEPTIFAVSAWDKRNVADLLDYTADLVDKTSAFSLAAETPEATVVRRSDQPAFSISRGPDAVWEINGPKIDRLMAMTNFQHDESILRFSRQLKGMGVEDALKAKGAKDGDTVRIHDYEFEFYA